MAFKMRGSSLRLQIAIVGAMAFLLQGYGQAVVNGVITLDSFLETFPEVDTIHSSGAARAHHATTQGLAVASYELGSGFGALSLLMIGDRLGRRRSVFVAEVVVLLGIALQATAFKLPQLITARAIMGIGVGASVATIPMYVSETCRPDQRGRLILLEGIFGSAGLALACWVNFGFYFVHSSANWRFPIAFPAVFASFIAVVVLFLPESPRWLVMQDKLEEASKVVGLLNNVPANSEEVHRQVESILNALNADLQTSHSNNPFSLTKNRHLHRTVLAVVLCMITQLTGINVVTFYSNTILQTDLGFSGLAARALSGAMQLVTIVGAALGCFLIDRVNLRFLLLLSLGIMATCQWSLAGLFSIASNEAANKASIFFYFLALFGFTIGLFLGPFMYAAEIAPLSIRAKVTALAGASSWFFNFAVVEVTPIAFDSIGWKYYLVYGALSTFAILVVVLFYPDTIGTIA